MSNTRTRCLPHHIKPYIKICCANQENRTGPDHNSGSNHGEKPVEPQPHVGQSSQSNREAFPWECTFMSSYRPISIGLGLMDTGQTQSLTGSVQGPVCLSLFLQVHIPDRLTTWKTWKASAPTHVLALWVCVCAYEGVRASMCV